VSQVLNTLAPIFLVVALGAAIARGGLLTAGLLKGVNRLVYWVALPALLFYDTVTANYHGTGVGRLVLVMFAATVPAVVLGAIYARLARLNPAAAGTLVHVAMRGNLTYVGLPVLLYLASVRGPGGPRPTAIILAFAPFLVFQNVVSILLLLVGRDPFGWRMVRSVARSIVTNPLLVAVGAGLLACAAGLSLPLVLARSLEAVGQIASPLALIGIGGSLLLMPVRAHWGNAALAAFAKVAVVPFSGWLLGRWAGLPPNELIIALVFLACPTAVASFPLVSELGGDEALCSTGILLSTLFSAVSLAVVVGCF
jgi:predicted permease